MPADESQKLLVARIRNGDEGAWEEFIARFEGRLLAFVDSRLRNRAASEDVVQETFMGFLISLPNYDAKTPLESFLFAIAAHKLTDLLRREGRRPTIPMLLTDSEGRSNEPAGTARVASSLIRSKERRGIEDEVLANCLAQLIEKWKKNEDFERMKCLELLLVLGHSNKNAAEQLGITEQAVANHKHFVVSKLKDAATQARLTHFDLAEYGIK